MKFSATTGAFYPTDVAYPKGAIPADAIAVTRDDFQRAMARGPRDMLAVECGKLVISRAPELTAQEVQSAALAELRIRRDMLLGQSDWTQLPDCPLSTERRRAWAIYRQALRDLPAAASEPATAEWPEAPNS